MEKEARGVVAIVVRASRALGVAPLSGTGTGRGVAQLAHAIYGAALIAALDIIIVVSMIIDGVQKAETTDSKYEGNNYFSLVLAWKLDAGLTILIASVGAWSGRDRITRLLEHIDWVEKIKIETTTKDKKQWWEKKRVAFSLLLFILPVANIGFTFIYHVKKKINENEQSLIPLHVFGTYLILHIVKAIVQQQILLVLFSIHGTMTTVTEELGRIHENVPETRPLSDKESASLRRIGRTYGHICDVVSRVNKYDGLLMLIMFINYFFFIISGVYWAIEKIFEIENDKSTFVDTAIEATWNSLNIIFMVVYVEPCHQFYNEVEKSRVVLSRLMYRTQAAGEPSALAVDVLCKQLLLDAPAFAPLGVCTITRSLCTTIISTATTYLVYIEQHRKNVA